MSNFFQANQQIPEEVKQIIRYASEDEVTEIMLQSLRMAVENPDSLAQAMPNVPAEMVASLRFFPKTDAALRPMARVMAQLLIDQVKYGKNPSPEEITRKVSEALLGSGALMPGMGAPMGAPSGGNPFNVPPQPGITGLSPGALGTVGRSSGAVAANLGPRLDPEVTAQVDKHISNGKNRLAEQEFEEAEKEFARAAEILDEHGAKNDLLFTALQHQSIAQLEQAEYLKAEPVLKRWLRLGEEIYSPEYGLLAGAYLGLARVRESQQKMEDAELLYKRALTIAERTGEQDAQSYIATIDSVAYFYESRKRYKKADPLFEKSYALSKKLYGENTVELADYEIEFALVLNERGQHEEAIDWCKRAVACKKELLGGDDSETLEASVQLAEIMFDAKDYTNAEPLLRTAIDGFEGSFSEGLYDALELLAQVLNETGRSDEAQKIEKRLQEKA